MKRNGVAWLRFGCAVSVVGALTLAPVLTRAQGAETARPSASEPEDEGGFFHSIGEFFSPSPVLRTAEEKYSRGVALMEDGDYGEAVTAFSRVLAEHPYSARAVEAEFRIALAQYFGDKRIEAESSFAEFRRQHPAHELVPWALYYEAMCRYTDMDTMDRDQTAARVAIDRFRLFAQRFPTHPLRVLVDRRLAECVRRVADHELYIARFYVRVEDYRAAIGRLDELLVRFPGTGVEPAALELSARAHAHRHEWDEANRAVERLTKEFPGSPEAQNVAVLQAEIAELKQAAEQGEAAAPNPEDTDDAESFLGPNF